MKVVMGIDHGNGWVKARSNSVAKMKYISALARPESFGEGMEVGKDVSCKKFVSEKFKNEIYCWGKDVTKADELLPTYAHENRYLDKHYNLLSEFIMGALLPNNAPMVLDILVVTGCPSREKGTEAESALKKVFEGNHLVFIDDESRGYRVTECIVLPQPLGAVLDLYLTEDGYVQDESYETATVAVIDLGSGTSDLDVISNLRRQKGKSDTIRLGMNNIYMRMMDYIISQHPTSIVTIEKGQEQFEQDNYVISKRLSVPIKQKREELIREHFEALKKKIDQRWPDKSSFDKIILTGGGAQIQDLANMFIKWEKDIIVAPNSQSSNANGFYKFGKYKAMMGEGKNE
jgi:plasmid segregation protein ParM